MMMSAAARTQETTAPFPLNLEMAVALTARAWQARLTERLSRIGLTAAQWRALRALAQRRGGLGQRELAAIIGVEEPGVVRLVDTLEAAGLVVRQVASKDRRSRIVSVTDAAQPVIEQARKICDGLCRELRDGVSVEDIEVSNRLMRRLLYKLQSLRRSD